MNSFWTIETTPRTSTRTPKIQEFRLQDDSRAGVRDGYRSVEDVAGRLADVIGTDRLRAGRSRLAAAYADEGLSVRLLRLKAGLSQMELAEAIGATQPHVSRIESGKCDIQFETARKLRDVLGVDMNTLDQALVNPCSERGR